MLTFEKIKSDAWKSASDKLNAWRKQHKEEYSIFVRDMAKAMHNDYSCLERVFKMAVRYVPVPVLVECEKLFEPNMDTASPEKGEDDVMSVEDAISDIMALRGYLSIGMKTVSFDSDGHVLDDDDEDGKRQEGTCTYIMREYSLSQEDKSDDDEEHVYLPFDTTEEFWESLPSFMQLVVFNISRGHSALELATIVKRIMISASITMPNTIHSISESIAKGEDTLLMNTLYYFCKDHGITKMAIALGKISLEVKQISYLRDGVKETIEKMVEVSLTNGYNKKQEWRDGRKEIPDADLQRTISATLEVTKGKSGRQHFEPELDLNDWLVGHPTFLKSMIMRCLSEMEHDYDLAFLWMALLQSNHLKYMKFFQFYHAICTYTKHDYQYDRAQRMATLICYHEEKFKNSHNPSIRRGRKIVADWTKKLAAIP